MGPYSKNCMMIADFYREPNIWVAWRYVIDIEVLYIFCSPLDFFIRILPKSMGLQLFIKS